MREDFYAEYFQIEDRHWWFVGRRRIVLEVLNSHLPLDWDHGTARVLDFGCGTGTMLHHLRQFGEADGVDADEAAVRFCHKRGEAGVRLLRAGQLPFDDDAFDLVTALDVLEHIKDDRAAVREIARVLRPGGLFLGTVPAYRWMWGPQDEISHHFRRYNARELEALVSDSALDVQRLSYFNTILFPPIAAIRLVRRLRPSSGEVRSDFEMTSEGRWNDLLAGVFASEARWVRRRDLPVGVSLLVLAAAPPSATAVAASE